MMRKMLRKNCAALLALALAAGPLAAQQQQQAPAAAPASRQIERPPDFSSGKRNPVRTYGPMRVERAMLENSARLPQLVQDGKLRLSLEDAIVLALENNLDISVQRFSPQIASADLLRAKSGAGSPAGSFDPVLTGTLGWERRTTAINNPFLAGTGTPLSSIISYTSQANFSLGQAFHTGTSYSITWNNNRQSTSNPATFLNPSTQSTLVLAFSQPLLNGFGLLPNTAGIRIARNNKRVADYTFENQVILTVSNVQNLYWDLVFAIEDVKVKQRSVELAKKLYNDNRRQVEIGTLAPIEVVRAESEVARTTQDLVVSETIALRAQTLLKNAISKQLMDPALLSTEIEPTDTIRQPPAIETSPLPEAVREAWEKRPDIKQARINLESNGISVRTSKNALLPSLRLNGSFSGVGLAGNLRVTTFTPDGTFSPSSTRIVDSAGNIVMLGGLPLFTGVANGTTASSTIQGGYSDALELLRQFRFPTYGVSLTLNIPVMNRAALADNARAQLEQRQAETSLKRLENSIVVEVRNAQIAVQQSQASLEAARKSRELAERTLDAEQKKYQLGASTIFFVIQAQRDLAAAESVELNSLVAIAKAKIELERAVGRTLEVNRISMAEALDGNVIKDPLIPGTPPKDLMAYRVRF